MSATQTPITARRSSTCPACREAIEPGDQIVRGPEGTYGYVHLSCRGSAPEQERSEAPADLQPGVYEVDGVAYVVKPNRAKDRLYAKRIRELDSTRSTEAGTFVAVEFDYEPGAVFRIRPEHRMTGERAKQLTLRYGKCICCGRDLRTGESVEQGIGPVCVKNFPELEVERKAIKTRARQEAKAAAASLFAEPVPFDDEHDPPRAIAGGAQSLTELAARIESRPEGDSDDFNRRWVEHKNEFARHEAEQERAAYEAEMLEERRQQAPTPYSVLLAINEPDVAVTVRYEVRATSKDDAVARAWALARDRFGGWVWEVEAVEENR